MTVTIDGITYEGTPAEIRSIVENPPVRKRHKPAWDRDTDDGVYPWTDPTTTPSPWNQDPWKTPRFPGEGFPYPGYPVHEPIMCNTVLY